MKKPIPWNTAAILEATQGDLLCGDINASFAGISIDSRTIQSDDLFVAIKGDVHDGHHFISDVIEHGGRGLIISKKQAGTEPGRLCQTRGIICVAVDDTIKALGDLAAFQRRRSKAAVVAVTGSNGKTTTRRMTAAVVAQCFNTLSTVGNLNNEIGLPLTLLNLNPDHQWAVVELGMNRPGEIERLGAICAPDIGLITNIGPAHLEGLVSIDAVMAAKGELLDQIKPGGTAVLNADDRKLLQLAARAPSNPLWFGLSENALVRANSIQPKGLGLSFRLLLPSESILIDLATPGSFMISNALAAAAVGHLLEIGAADIKAGLEKFQPVKGRLNLHQTSKGVNIIDDTYNANPGSMRAAIATLHSLKANNRGALIIGDMLELGDHSQALHHQIGALAANSEINRIYSTGKFAEAVASGARDEGMDSGNIMVGSKDEIFASITGWLESGDWVLIKGSRSMAMETIVAQLLDWADG